MSQRVNELLRAHIKNKKRRNREELAKATEVMRQLIVQIQQQHSIIESCTKLLENPGTSLENELLMGPVVLLDRSKITLNNILFPCKPGEMYNDGPFAVLVDVWEIDLTVTLVYDHQDYLISDLEDPMSTIMESVADEELGFEVERISNAFPLERWENKIRNSKKARHAARSGNLEYPVKCWVVRLRERSSAGCYD